MIKNIKELYNAMDLCECKGSGGIRMDGTCARCNKPLELAED